MSFYADLHIHSKYSRATSRTLDLEHLALWANKKGIGVVGTGDFTHPAWMKEIREKLIPAEPGLFQLRKDLANEIQQKWNCSFNTPIRFLLEVEVSTIYKKGDKVRKVHHLIYAPDLEKADRLISRLARIGNLNADGRPILGLDSRHLLEITLEAGEDCYLIPAHIWTPWFSVFGSKSGFDVLEDCYGDLTSEIFALETGLSSNPPMNWRLSALDRFTLISNSDAHSPEKLGREACRFDTELNYFAIKQALETGMGYAGTVEFFPEEGKYHLDGCRNCEVRLLPEQTRERQGICPSCGKPITIGVMHRISELADRQEEILLEQKAPFCSFIPLCEMIAETQLVGVKSKKVEATYQKLITQLGSELFILNEAPLDEIKCIASPLLSEAVHRMRQGKVIREAGYDGEYGTIRLFQPDELASASGPSFLFEPSTIQNLTPISKEIPSLPSTTVSQPKSIIPSCEKTLSKSHSITSPSSQGIFNALDAEQNIAAAHLYGPLLIVAGPGTGKTRTMTHRIAHLIDGQVTSPESCLTLTFTHRAAEEMKERLKKLIPQTAAHVPVMTFHSLGLALLHEQTERLNLPSSFRIIDPQQQLTLMNQTLGLSERKIRKLLKEISRIKRSVHPLSSDSEIQIYFQQYQKILHNHGWIDFDDLIALPIKLLNDYPELVVYYQQRYQWISVDEYQDIDEVQYQLLKQLAPTHANLCIIGDPDQAIYGFRGSDVRIFTQFQTDYPSARILHLTRNYRSTCTIVNAAAQLIALNSPVKGRTFQAFIDDATKIEIHTCHTDRAEAEWVVQTIETLIGGSSLFSFDSGRVEQKTDCLYSFSDFAVLYRTEMQAKVLMEAFARSGIPYQQHSHQRLIDYPFVQSLIQIIEAQTTHEPLALRLQQAAEQITQETDEQDKIVQKLLLHHVLQLAKRHHDDLDSFFTDLNINIEMDLWDPRADRVSLLTIHASKGLEFPVVFLVGCEDGLLPLQWANKSQKNEAEERRLFFVGMTRAKNHLFLSHAQKRQWQKRIVKNSISPFLKAIEETLLERYCHHSLNKKTVQHNFSQLDLFS